MSKGILDSELRINRINTEPLYKQVENLLEELIYSNFFDEKSNFFSEIFLAKELGVSRNTIRKAVDILVNKGIVLRNRPKGLTIAQNSSKILEEKINGLSCTEAMVKSGNQIMTKVVSFKKVKASDRIAKILLLEKGEEVFFIKRLRIVNNFPSLLTSSYIPTKFIPGFKKEYFSEEGMEQSLYYNLEVKFNLPIFKWVEELKPMIISGKAARFLKLKDGSPGILRKDLIYSNSGKIIAYNTTTIGSNYKIKGLTFLRERYKEPK